MLYILYIHYMKKLQVTLFDVKVGDEFHTIFQTSDTFIQDSVEEKSNSATPFNLIMVDVSGSMKSYWDAIMNYWNKFMSPALKGETKLLVFGSSVYFRRNGTAFEVDDFLSQTTNLTEAIKRINSEIQNTDKKFIRLFLITDGHHNSTSISPDTEIAKLSIPCGKTIEVYLLGVGNRFPVEYSITIRSALHNGNSNIPSLFWAKCEYESGAQYESLNGSITQQILSMAEIVKKSHVKLKISPHGKLAPGFPETDITHLGEFVYFSRPSKEISSTLNLLTEGNVSLRLDLIKNTVSLRYLVDEIFCQWNSLIIQQHRNEKEVPTEAFEIMENIYKNLHEELLLKAKEVESKAHFVKARLKRKEIKYLETQFATLMNQSKTIIGLSGRYHTELELARNILNTTVKSKYDTKNLKMKGYCIKNYTEDMKEFTSIYENIKDAIMSLPEPTADDCCRITMGSLVKDLQDPSLYDLLQEDKFTFMKTLTVTGIPIFAPIKDSSQINPWTLCIESILNSPYDIISQNTLELYEEVKSLPSESENKEVYLQGGDESTRFNAIVPVVEPAVSEVLKPLIRTNMFAMLSTFCILKNPHIIDHNAHIAALGCTWMKIITDYPASNQRPEFIRNRITLIETTGKLYLDRGHIVKYLDVLLTKPNEALMTESVKKYGKKTIKCESLIKPAFLLFLTRENLNWEPLPTLSLMIVEFIGRCLSNYSQDLSKGECIYSRFFLPEFSTKGKRKKRFKQKLRDTCSSILEAFIREKRKLLQTYYTIDDLRKGFKSFCCHQLKLMEESIYGIHVNIEMVNRLKNTSSAGHIQLKNLKTFAREMKISKDTIKELFSTDKLFVYVFHGLQHTNSRERMTTPLLSYEDVQKKVKNLVQRENVKTFKRLATLKTMEEVERIWSEEFLSYHANEIVRPMTQREIIDVASQREVTVTHETFNRIYKYNPKNGLLGNACMVESCPFYLKPNETFNQHISAERQLGYPHQLHKVTLRVVSTGGDVNVVIKTLLDRKCDSQCGKKLTPIPSAVKLNFLKGEIERLMNDYKQFLG